MKRVIEASRKLSGAELAGVASVLGLLVALVPSPAAAHAAVRRVPQTYATIQAAIGASNAGDTIEVGPGSYCGAALDRPVHLVGRGQPTIIGCPESPTLAAGERIGFYLPATNFANPASGSSIQGFTFDGRGISQTNLEPLGVGIIARSADDIQIEHNLFLGTIQAITNTAGDRWLIAFNRIVGLTLFDCTGALCGGGSGIVLQLARGADATAGGPADPVNRPEHNVVVDNQVSATIPDGFDVFSMAGIFVLAADDTLIARNTLDLPDNPTAEAAGQGVLVSNSCCGQPAFLPGARNTVIVANDGRRSEFAVVIEGTGGANTSGLVLLANSGTVEVEGQIVASGGRPCRKRVARGPHHRDMY
jgi:hypothetical protein